MSKLPLVNRKTPVKLLDTDLIEVNRRLHNGEIVALKINRTDITEHNTVPEIDYYEEGKGSFTDKMRKVLYQIPVLPSKTCYGYQKYISEILWINNSFEIDLKSLEILDDVKSDTKESWIKETYGQETTRQAYVSAHNKWRAGLDEVKQILEVILNDKQNYLNSVDGMNPLIPKQLSCLRKYVASLDSLKNILTEALANATAKVNYIEETPLPPPPGGPKREGGSPGGGEKKTIK